MCSIPRPLRDGGGEPKFTKHFKLLSGQDDDTEGRRHNHSLRMVTLYIISDSPNLLIGHEISPSEVMLDNQSVKSAAFVHKEVDTIQQRRLKDENVI